MLYMLYVNAYLLTTIIYYTQQLVMYVRLFLARIGAFRVGKHFSFLLHSSLVEIVQGVDEQLS